MKKYKRVRILSTNYGKEQIFYLLLRPSEEIRKELLVYHGKLKESTLTFNGYGIC